MSSPYPPLGERSNGLIARFNAPAQAQAQEHYHDGEPLLRHLIERMDHSPLLGSASAPSSSGNNAGTGATIII